MSKIKELITYIKSKQAEYKYGSSAYNLARHFIKSKKVANIVYNGMQLNAVERSGIAFEVLLCIWRIINLLKPIRSRVILLFF